MDLPPAPALMESTGKAAVDPGAKAARSIPWGAAVVMCIAVGLLLLGARGFYLRGHFGFRDAVYCGIEIVPAALLVLLTGYVVQHARLVAVMPLAMAVLLVLAYPSFAAALGLALLGAILVPALRDWSEARHQASSTSRRAI